VGDLMYAGKLVHLSIVAGDKLTVKTAAVCADKAQADDLKKQAETTLKDLKTLLKNSQAPADFAKALLAGLDNTKLSTSGARGEGREKLANSLKKRRYSGSFPVLIKLAYDSQPGVRTAALTTIESYFTGEFRIIGTRPNHDFIWWIRESRLDEALVRMAASAK